MGKSKGRPQVLPSNGSYCWSETNLQQTVRHLAGATKAPKCLEKCWKSWKEQAASVCRCALYPVETPFWQWMVFTRAVGAWGLFITAASTMALHCNLHLPTRRAQVLSHQEAMAQGADSVPPNAVAQTLPCSHLDTVRLSLLALWPDIPLSALAILAPSPRRNGPTLAKWLQGHRKIIWPPIDNPSSLGRVTMAQTHNNGMTVAVRRQNESAQKGLCYLLTSPWVKLNRAWGFPCSPVAKTRSMLPMQGARVWSLIMELDPTCCN